MNGSTSSPSGFLQGLDVGQGLTALREAVDRFRSPADDAVATRPERDGVRAAVLTALAEAPADGYSVVRLLEQRGGGQRTPGAGAVYPMLQLLFDEGLVTPAETDGRKTWTLTAAGRAAADAAQDGPEPQRATAATAAPRRAALARSSAQLAQAVALAAQDTTRAQQAEVAEELDETRRRILAILARS